MCLSVTFNCNRTFKMTTEVWKIENNLCRCCHSEGIFMNLAVPCDYMGQKEIYTEMLRDCLAINVAPVRGALCTVTYTICDACIMRLRDACCFKQQVLDCEKQFQDMFSQNILKAADSNSHVEVKIEMQDHNSNDSTDKFDDEHNNDDHHDDDDDDDIEDTFEVNLDEDDELETLEAIKRRTERAAKRKMAEKTPTAKKPKKPAKKSLDEKVSAAIAKATGVPKKTRVKAAPPFRLCDDDYTRDGDNYSCTRCDKTYNKFCSLRYHIKSKHYRIPKYLCQYCDKSFMTAAPLTVHKLEDHKIDERFNCNACKGTFNTKTQLRKHINIFHMLGERFKCDFCEYESFSFEGMYKHKFKHKTVKDYHCKFCKKSFLRKTTLDLHERIHTGDRRKVCTVCGQAFVQKASLNYHMTKYHPEVNF